jgi:hypothetical protein
MTKYWKKITADTSKHGNFLTFCYFCGSFFAFLDPDPRLIESEYDQEQKKWFISIDKSTDSPSKVNL